RLWAAPGNAFFGTTVRSSDDLGGSWSGKDEGSIRFPEESDLALTRVWQIRPGREEEPERLFLQNHWGLYRSGDWGDSWEDVANGVPSDFGFAMAMHPHDPDTVYIVPMESDGFRCCPEAKLRVYRTRDAGESWHPLGEGLPQEGAYETVLRDALDTDDGEPAGVYFGTRSGKLWASGDDGERWSLVRDGLPPVVCVKAARLW
ncbi:MAG TPA: hypothetical protein VE173_08310, partial [Longimicrobiales bacterium]|nr:hypothetical protein [Longimicrobiales bacterium]